MFFGKKERKTEQLILDHIESVGRAVAALDVTMQDYCRDKKFKKKAIEVEDLETEADSIRREIELSLYDGAFLPVQRGDYARLVEAVDKVANQCEEVSQFLRLTRPELDAGSIEGLTQIMEATVRCFAHLPTMFAKFDQGREVVELAHWVEEEEKAVDEIFDKTTRRLFKSELDLAKKLHIKLLLDRTAAITNRIEDASDRFQVIVATRPS